MPNITGILAEAVVFKLKWMSVSSVCHMTEFLCTWNTTNWFILYSCEKLFWKTVRNHICHTTSPMGLWVCAQGQILTSVTWAFEILYSECSLIDWFGSARELARYTDQCKLLVAYANTIKFATQRDVVYIYSEYATPLDDRYNYHRHRRHVGFDAGRGYTGWAKQTRPLYNFPNI